MIKVNQVDKKFGDFYALNHISLHVNKGSIYGLVGPNGAGKSTLIRHLTGVYKQDGGDILINDMPVYDNPEIKYRIGYIPDGLFYFVQDSISDMVKFYSDVYPDFDIERFHRLEEVFTTLNPKKRIRKMSKGMQKQAAFWLEICRKPEVLILDEPVDGLDPVMRRQIWNILLQDVAERETTVLVSSHNLRELEDVCDSVGIMNKGSLLLERSLSDLQGGFSKLQVAFKNNERPEGLNKVDILHESHIGSVYTFIIKGSVEESKNILATFAPLFMEAVPLTLEEIFIYELGGENYEVKDIIL